MRRGFRFKAAMSGPVIADIGTMPTAVKMRSVNKIEMAGCDTTRARNVDPAIAAGAPRTCDALLDLPQCLISLSDKSGLQIIRK